MIKRCVALIGILVTLLLIGCTATNSGADSHAEPKSTPTMFPFLEPETSGITVGGSDYSPLAAPTIASLFSLKETPTPRPTSPPLPTLPPFKPAITRAEGITEMIYDEGLSGDWKIKDDPNVVVDLRDQLRVYDGEYALAFTPKADFTPLFFTLSSNAKKAYPAENVIGVGFWLNGGDDLIALDEMAVAVIGSNDYPYYDADDDSVDFPEGEYFSETRLYFLDLNRSIPPETWVEVYLPLDSLIYDPLYKYVVGFYLKNDEGFRNTVYVDNVKLILVEDSNEIVQETAPGASSMAETPSPESEQLVGMNGGLIDYSSAVETAAEGNPDALSGQDESNADSLECIVSMTEPPVEGWELYILKADDVVSNLAVERGVSFDFILSQNCLEESDAFNSGQQIWLPPPP